MALDLKFTEDQAIRALSRTDYWYFNEYFFESELPSPEFHKELVSIWESGEEFIAIAAPRGHAKTTVLSVRHNLYDMLHAKENYILLVEDTYTQAKSVIAAIRYHISTNQKIRSVYHPKIIQETQDTLVIETIYGRSRITARGTGQSLRGILDETEKRPSVIVCDDLEKDDRVDNSELREDDWLWFWKVLLPARAKGGRVRVIGSILHRDSLLNRLIEMDSWRSLKYSVKVAEGQTIWPEHMDWDDMLKKMDEYRQANQIHTFYCEYFNDPIDPDNIEFKSQWIQVVSLDQETLDGLIVTTTVDLAISKRESACYTAMVTAAWGRTNPPLVYILDVRRGRWGVYEQINQMFKLKHAYGVSTFGIEKVQYQEALKEVFEMEQQRRQDWVNVELLPAKQGKDERIRGMHALYNRGQVKWASEFPILREEHLSFPRGVSKDCIDAEAYQLKLNSISPKVPATKPKMHSGGALIDSVMKRRRTPQLGAY